uniref:Alcohol dehydrogenase-like N-terminal domain-containing protein n=1 Tax=Leptobrachium leishanense TaxID=445787 RepID=A0A8C5PWU3_9ANUR
MKGLYYQLNGVAPDEMFFFQETDNIPPPSEYHVKLQVKACALSPINTKFVSEVMNDKASVPVGREVTGTVLEVGSKVSFFQPDDEVAGILPLDCDESGLSELLWVHEHNLVLKPEKVSWVEALHEAHKDGAGFLAMLAVASPHQWWYQ